MPVSCRLVLAATDGDSSTTYDAEFTVWPELEVENVAAFGVRIREAINALCEPEVALLGDVSTSAVAALPGGTSATALLLLALADKLGYVVKLTPGVDMQDLPYTTTYLRGLVGDFVASMDAEQEYGLPGLVGYHNVVDYAYVAEQRDEALRATEVNVVARRKPMLEVPE